MKHTLEGDTKVDKGSILQLAQCCKVVEKDYPGFLVVPVMITNRRLPDFVDQMTLTERKGKTTSSTNDSNEIRDAIGELNCKRLYIYDASNIKNFFAGMAHWTKSKGVCVCVCICVCVCACVSVFVLVCVC